MAGCVQLFSKQSTAGARRAGSPTPIKFTLQLGGFGSALLLDGQGCAMDCPPYRSACDPCFHHVCARAFGIAATMVSELQLYAQSLAN